MKNYVENYISSGKMTDIHEVPLTTKLTVR